MDNESQKKVRTYSNNTITFFKRDGRLFADALDVFNWMQLQGVDKRKKK